MTFTDDTTLLARYVLREDGVVMSKHVGVKWLWCHHIVGGFGWYCILGENIDSKCKEEIILQSNIASRVHVHPVDTKLHHPAVLQPHSVYLTATCSDQTGPTSSSFILIGDYWSSRNDFVTWLESVERLSTTIIQYFSCTGFCAFDATLKYATFSTKRFNQDLCRNTYRTLPFSFTINLWLHQNFFIQPALDISRPSYKIPSPWLQYAILFKNTWGCVSGRFQTDCLNSCLPTLGLQAAGLEQFNSVIKWPLYSISSHVLLVSSLCWQTRQCLVD